MMSSFFFLTQFLQDVRHLSALATGLAFLPMAIGMFTMTRLVPRLLPRFGPKPLVLTGTVLLVVGLLMLTRLSVDSGYAAAVFAPMLVLGVGGGLGFVPLTPVIMATVEAADAGAAGGALQTMQQIGASLGLAVLVSVFGAAVRHAGPVSPPVGLVTGMTTAFTVAAGMASGVLLVALTFRRHRARQS
jgi:predicted MFS family arabinose efflux permease